MKTYAERLFLMLFIALLVACEPQGQKLSLDADSRRITLAMTQEPPDLNTSTSTDQVSFMVIGHIFEGLMRYAPDGQLIGGVAERWSLNERGARFELRRDARWNDGSAVTADDFVFAWQTVLNPATASEYAFILYPLKNARQVNEGTLPPDALGVRAIDDFTLEVEFDQPCPYFLDLTAFGLLSPINRTFYQQRPNRYAAEVADILSNGPFQLTHWVHGAALRMEKNPHYWNAESVWLNTIDVPYITDDSTARMNLYRDGRIVIAEGLSEEALLGALNERMQVKSFLDGSIFYVEFNHREGSTTANWHVRRAIQLVLNVDDLVYKVIGSPGTLPARTLYPRWMRGIEQPFVRENPPPMVTLDVAQAQQHIAMAKAELGVEELPPLMILADGGSGRQTLPEYLQTRLKQTLGLEVKIDAQSFKQRLAKMSRGEFDLVLAGWGPDYNDLLTYADLFHSENMNNRGRYANDEYDRWVDVARQKVEPAERMEAFAQLQDILINDVVILPLFERGTNYIEHPRLQGVVRTAIGADPNFIYTQIAPEKN